MIASLRRAGFTLLEVMVAVLILAIALTAVFASQGGAMKSAHRARYTSHAALLARCKMGEIEEMLVEDGLPAIEERGSDNCCEDAEVPGFSCDWVVERIQLPTPELEDDSLGLGEALAEGESGEDDANAAGASSVEDVLAGGGEGDLVSELANGYAWPILQPAVEAQVRRIRVTVKWNEAGIDNDLPCLPQEDGPRRASCFDVVQYYVAEPSDDLPAAPDDDEAT